MPEIGALLGDDADVARRRFGIEPGGNAPQDPQGEFTGKNLLYTAQSIEDVAARTGRSRRRGRRRAGPHSRRAVRRARDAAAAASRRQDPDRLERPDDRRVRARRARARAIGRAAARYLDAAAAAASFIRARLWTPTARLLRRYRDGDAAIDGYAEDYAS